MKSSLLYAALALYGLFPNKILQASENRFTSYPRSVFRIAETLHKPRFSIVEVETGYNVTIKYEANIEGLDRLPLPKVWRRGIREGYLPC